MYLLPFCSVQRNFKEESSDFKESAQVVTQRGHGSAQPCRRFKNPKEKELSNTQRGPVLGQFMVANSILSRECSVLSMEGNSPGSPMHPGSSERRAETAPTLSPSLVCPRHCASDVLLPSPGQRFQADSDRSWRELLSLSLPVHFGTALVVLL